MSSKSEQLLPIVAGCRALVTAYRYAGREVKVVERFTAEYSKEHGFIDTEHLIGSWVCTAQVDGLDRMLLIFEKNLMRIDGYQVSMLMRIVLGGGKRGKCV